MGYSTVVFTFCLLFCTTVYSSKASRPCPPCYCEKDCACGYRYDENGCKICQCRPCRCPAVASDPPCRCGSFPDPNFPGCPTCNCKPCLSCPRIGCQHPCKCGSFPLPGLPHCPSCNCKPCNKPRCGDHICALGCPCGFALDDRGCQICKCKKCGPDICLTCCGPPPCCNYCGLETRPDICLHCGIEPPLPSK